MGLSVIVDIVIKIFKTIFGTDTSRKNTVDHAEQEIKIDDGKKDRERLKDLGL